MMRVCAACKTPQTVHTYAAEGPLCWTCVNAASTRVEAFWIRGQRFNVTRKGVEKGRVVPLAARA